MDRNLGLALVEDCFVAPDFELPQNLANIRAAKESTRGANDKAWQPVKLSILQRGILELHLAGLKQAEIANSLGCTKQMVYLTVTSELGKAFTESRLRYVDEDLERLYIKVVDAIEEGLDSENTELKLKSVDRFERLSTRLKKRENKHGGVETMMQRMLELVKSAPDGSKQSIKMTETVAPFLALGGTEVGKPETEEI